MNKPPLNPDGVLNAMDILMAETDADARAAEWARKVATRVLEGYFAAAVPEVTSVEELKALPIGSVILDGGGDAGIIEPGAILFAETNPLSPEYVAKNYLPARVLYLPEVKS